MSPTNNAQRNSLLFVLANRVAEQTPYTIDQALLGVQGLLSFYEDDNAVCTAVAEFICCLNQEA